MLEEYNDYFLVERFPRTKVDKTNMQYASIEKYKLFKGFAEIL